MKPSRVFFTGLLFFSILTLAANLSASTPGDADVPVWLQQAARSAAPSYDKEVPAVVLHNEQSVNVGADGLMTVTTYHAVRLLRREGKYYADAGALYIQSSSKVRDLRAWLIRTDGTHKFFGKDSVLDKISDPDDVYDEYRIKTIDGSGDADIGMVFGFVSVVEERPLFTQDRWEFQHHLPTLFSRYTLNLPTGWQANSVTFNRPEIKPSVTGTSYVWEQRELGAIPPEPDGLSVMNLAPRIVVNYFPSNANAHVYDSWRDVSKWYTDLSASSLTLDDEIAGKARDLTANAKTDLEKIRAIADYVQAIRYISLQMDVARGGALRPRPATMVLRRGFGDCKDKANLMRAMLKALKIESYLVLIYSGDPTFVRAEWASPRQFNHCIIAIKVGADTNASTVITHERLGRLLIFDATDPYTQVGDLPDHEQGSYALIAAGAEGDLVKMPILPPDANKLERHAEVSLTPDGAISGRIHQQSFGQSATRERGRLRELSAAEYATSVQKWLATRIKGGNVIKAVPVDRKAEGKFDLDMEFSAPSYAQIMQGRLMVFKPAMVGRLDQFAPIEGKRITPILIDSSSYSETIKVKLPDGFVIDEIPEANGIEASFGKYTAKYEVNNGYILLTRSLILNRTILPAASHDEVKNFFGVVRSTEDAPVVLLRK
jgi:hypothetical protein